MLVIDISSLRNVDCQISNSFEMLFTSNVLFSVG